MLIALAVVSTGAGLCFNQLHSYRPRDLLATFFTLTAAVNFRFYTHTTHITHIHCTHSLIHTYTHKYTHTPTIFFTLTAAVNFRFVNMLNYVLWERKIGVS